MTAVYAPTSSVDVSGLQSTFVTNTGTVVFGEGVVTGASVAGSVDSGSSVAGGAVGMGDGADDDSDEVGVLLEAGMSPESAQDARRSAAANVPRTSVEEAGRRGIGVDSVVHEKGWSAPIVGGRQQISRSTRPKRSREH